MNSLHSHSFREPRNANHTSTPRGARAITNVIPTRWLAAVLLIGTIVFFPVLILVIIIDAVTHDMPRFRFFMSRTGQFFRAGTQGALRFPRAWQNDWRLSDLARREATTAP
jgi:hypothetical protein